MARRRAFKRENGMLASAWFAGQSFHGALPVRGEATATAKTSPNGQRPALIESTDCEFCDIAVARGGFHCVLGHGADDASYRDALERAMREGERMRLERTEGK